MGLNMLEIAMEVEQEFDIEIPDDAAAEIRTVGDLTDWVYIAMDPKNPSGWTQPRIEQTVHEIVAKQLGVKVADLRPTTRFVEDLGAD